MEMKVLTDTDETTISAVAESMKSLKFGPAFAIPPSREAEFSGGRISFHEDGFVGYDDEEEILHFKKIRFSLLKDAVISRSQFKMETIVVQAPNSQNGSTLQDYQMELMLLEQQNKARLLRARQDQEAESALLNFQKQLLLREQENDLNKILLARRPRRQNGSTLQDGRGCS